MSMNILWIEDFGGTLSSGTETLELMFQGLLNFDDWDEDELNLIKTPSDLAKFCEQQNSIHRIYLCRHYFDYIEFKKNHSILNDIDVIITDIRLDNLSSDAFDLSIPEAYTDKPKFHENGGFYIFNDLIHLGVPAERMCFMSGEKNSFKAFEEKCAEIYIPRVQAFEKSDADYEKLRSWIDAQSSDYVRLRRGIIAGCESIAHSLHEGDLLFNNFIGEKDKKVSVNEMQDYLSTLANFLPLREPDNKEDVYKLFIRTLSHEWEAAEPKLIRDLAWVMKTTRNWMAHNSNLFNALDEQMLAYLFILNMRVMFNLNDKVQPYELVLLQLFNESTLEKEQFKDINRSRLMPISKAYSDLKNRALDKQSQEAFQFRTIANNLLNETSDVKGDKKLFIKLLYQMFWLTTSRPFVNTGRQRNTLEIDFRKFNYADKPYLFELARHIYKHSF